MINSSKKEDKKNIENSISLIKEKDGRARQQILYARFPKKPKPR